MKPGDIISYLEMCAQEGVNLQRGMNFHLHRDYSVILMSLRVNAPYADRIENDGRILIYEGHDVPKIEGSPIPKKIDQPMKNPGGTLTQNGLFYEAALRYKNGKHAPLALPIPRDWSQNRSHHIIGPLHPDNVLCVLPHQPGQYLHF